jgi:hypothetical protein
MDNMTELEFLWDCEAAYMEDTEPPYEYGV